MNRTHVVLIVTLVGAAAASCKQQAPKTAPAAISVHLLTVASGNQSQMLSYSGTIEAENTASIGFSVPGVVDRLNVQEGESVKQGQLLASLDATEYENALAIATAGLEQAEDMYQRLNSLYEKGSLPAKDYIDIKTKLAQARANQSINAKRIRDSRLLAPMSGIITAKMIERGSAAAPGVPAFKIVKTDKVYARVAVPEGEVGELQKGMAAGVYIPTLHDTIRGTITIINPQADEISRTYTVKIMLDNAKGRLLPGMITNVLIQTGKTRQAITVPATAIVRDADDITYVYTSNAQKKAVRKRVDVTGITGNNEAIVSGLSLGDQVVVAGQTRIKEGSTLAF